MGPQKENGAQVALYKKSGSSGFRVLFLQEIFFLVPKLLLGQHL
jgi:hypothetical protein